MLVDFSAQFGDNDARVTRYQASLRPPPPPPLAAAPPDDTSPPPAPRSTCAAVKAAAAADDRPIAQRLPKRSKRGLVMNGQYAANGFAPRAKRTKKPFHDPVMTRGSKPPSPR